jgi:hypothetical protein
MAPAHEAPADSSRLATLLRWLGAGALGLSAIVFLLQGLEQVDLAIRNWSYLALMAVLGALGVGVRYLFDDARSARLLLGLAVAVIPIQFAQLGGILHSLATGEVAVLGSLLDAGALSGGLAALVAAASLALFYPVAYAGFAVLARPEARRLSGCLLVPVLLLLLPWRDSVPGFAVVAALGALALLTDRHLVKLHARYRTLEGRAVRAILAVPFVIGAVRLGFHVDALAGFCGMLGLGGLTLMAIAQLALPARGLKALGYFLGTVLVSGAWLLFSCLELTNAAGAFDGFVVLGPISAFLIIASRFGGGRFYRGAGAAAAAIVAADLLTTGGSALALASLLLGVLLLAVGVLGRYREPVLLGAAVSVASVVMLAVEALAFVNVGNWVLLAVAGMTLVIGASLVERFGRRALSGVRRGVMEVAEWE